MNKPFALAFVKRRLLPAAMMLAAAFVLMHWTELKHMRVSQLLRNCVEAIPTATLNGPEAMAPLITCAEGSLPGYSDSWKFACLMQWILDSHTPKFAQQPQMMRSTLLSISQDVSPLEATLFFAAQVGWVISLVGWFLSTRRGRAGLAQPAPAERRQEKGVLVIDDDPRFARAMGRSLERKGIVVDYAFSAAEARARMAARSYDCVFCDFFLDEGSGASLCESVLGEEARRRCVIVSGNVSSAREASVESSLPFLAKPCGSEAILELAYQRLGAPAAAH